MALLPRLVDTSSVVRQVHACYGTTKPLYGTDALLLDGDLTWCGISATILTLNEGTVYTWVPYYGAPNIPRDNYVFRSSWSPQMNLGWDMRRTDLDYAWMRAAIAQWRSVANDFLGDYFPLLPYDSSESEWTVWQFDRPDLGKGVVQAFRRALSSTNSVRLKLHGLEADARYTLTDLDTQVAKSCLGSDLETTGIDVSMPDPGSSTVLSYVREQRGAKPE